MLLPTARLRRRKADGSEVMLGARRAAAAVMASLLCPTGPDAASNGTEEKQQLRP